MQAAIQSSSPSWHSAAHSMSVSSAAPSAHVVGSSSQRSGCSSQFAGQFSPSGLATQGSSGFSGSCGTSGSPPLPPVAAPASVPPVPPPTSLPMLHSIQVSYVPPAHIHASQPFSISSHMGPEPYSPLWPVNTYE